MLAALRKAKRGKSTTINLGTPEMDDLRWWRSLLKEHTGTVILDTDGWQGLDVHKIYTDKQIQCDVASKKLSMLFHIVALAHTYQSLVLILDRHFLHATLSDIPNEN